METTSVEGFLPLFRTSPFLDSVGPFFYRQEQASDPLVVAVRIMEKHCNVSGTVHGGLISTLADVALGYATAFSQEPPVRLTTVNLSLDFTGVARIGDWLEARTHIHKLGKRMAFANALIACGEEPVARASAVFHIPGS